MLDTFFKYTEVSNLNFSLKEDICAVLFYMCFLGYAIFKGALSLPLAHKALNRIHMTCVVVYILVSPFLFELNQSWLLSLFVLFSFHHIFFMNFFGIVRRSFSLNLLVAIDESIKKHLSIEEAYAEGKGLGYVQEIRNSAMLRENLILQASPKIKLTRKGGFLVTIRNLLLEIWNLSSSQENVKK